MKKRLLSFVLCAIGFAIAPTFAADGYVTVTDFSGTTTFSGTGLNHVNSGTFTGTGNGITFSVTGLNKYDSERLAYSGMAKNSTKTSNFSWTTPANHQVLLTKISTQIRAYQPATSMKPATAQFAGGTKVDCKTNSTNATTGIQTVSVSNNSGLTNPTVLTLKIEGDPKAVFVSTNTEFYIHSIEYTYVLSHEELDFEVFNTTLAKANEVYGGLDDKTTAEAIALNSAISAANTFYANNSDLGYKTNGGTPANVSSHVEALNAALANIRTADDVIADMEPIVAEARGLGMPFSFLTTAIENAEAEMDADSPSVATLINLQNDLLDAISQARGLQHSFNSINTLFDLAEGMGYDASAETAALAACSTDEEIVALASTLRTNTITWSKPLEFTEETNFSIFIQNNSFELGNTTGWLMESSIQSGDGVIEVNDEDHGVKAYSNPNYTTTPADGDYLWNSYDDTKVKTTITIDYRSDVFHTGKYLYQDLSGLPNGTYRLKARVSSDNGKQVILKANAAQTAIATTGAANFVEGTVEVNVTDGNLRIGVVGQTYTSPKTNNGIGTKVSRQYGIWYRADKFELYYMGVVKVVGDEHKTYVGKWTADEINATIGDALTANVTSSSVLSNATITPGNPNCIIYANAGQMNAAQANVVVDGNCANLVLTDGNAFAPVDDFHADAATYSRNMTSTYASICLPFDAVTDENVQLFTLGEVADGSISLIYADQLAAGTPAMLKKLDEEATSITISGTNVDVVKEPVVLSGTPHLVGTFARTMVGANDASGAAANFYALKNDEFHQGQNYFYSGAFRSYVDATGASLPASLFLLEEEIDFGGGDGMTTDVESAIDTVAKRVEGIYNMQGMRLGQVMPGIICIIRYTDGTCSKVLVK